MTQQMIATLKDEDQDFEWYPTTAAMAATVSRKLRDIYDCGFSLLDIGAGDGRVIQMIEENHKKATAIRWGDNNEREGEGLTGRYAIEKARPLLNALPDNVTIVGTDFTEQTLIDKQADVIFCNPPYSEYGDWMCRILREANAAHVFMIVPARWADNEIIQDTIRRREIRHEVLQSTDFADAQRAARARVDIIHFDLTAPEGERCRRHGHGDGPKVEPFDVWFADYFKVSDAAPAEQQSDHEKEKEQTERIHQLVRGKNQVTALVELYRADMDKLIANYQAVCALDTEILRELNVSVPDLKKAMKKKIAGLKSLYWKELFSKLAAITDRLTSKSREGMLGMLNKHMGVDFTEGNIYAVVVWALKNVNQYLESQLKDLYLRMTREENVRNFKSNAHMTKDTWRYCRNYSRQQDGDFRKSIHHYTLEYRIVLHAYNAIGDNSSWRHNHQGNLASEAHEYIGDILTIANNLGFASTNDSTGRQWESNQAQVFYCMKPKALTGTPIMEVRAFKNGNIHIKLDQDFMRAFNVEAARLFGWIKSPKEAAEEMGCTEGQAERAFRTNLQITTVPLLSA